MLPVNTRYRVPSVVRRERRETIYWLVVSSTRIVTVFSHPFFLWSWVHRNPLHSSLSPPTRIIMYNNFDPELIFTTYVKFTATVCIPSLALIHSLARRCSCAHPRSTWSQTRSLTRSAPAPTPSRRDKIAASLETLVGVAPTWRSLDNPRQRMSYEDRLSSEGDARKRKAIADKFLFAESVATQQRDVLKVRIPSRNGCSHAPRVLGPSPPRVLSRTHLTHACSLSLRPYAHTPPRSTTGTTGARRVPHILH